jgi:hypothetical protein
VTVLSNTLRAGGFIESEANFARSRDTVTIEGGTGGAGKLLAGTVIGKITSSGKYWASPATGVDGSQQAIAILFDAVDATAGDVEATVVAREAEVRGADLFYDPSVDDDAKKAAKAAQLLVVGIIVRQS